ncbi:MAG: hypothetical protein R2712_24470 [Vicinamibacterales bacterium]
MMAQPPEAPAVSVSRAELLWITFGAWTGGVCILTLLPLLLIPRLGIGAGMAASYLIFFLAWQPVQVVTQRVAGIAPAVVRMIVLVAAAAVCAYYLRELVIATSRG